MAIPDLRSDLNVTPLVDVCLVLLIIFMVVAPLLTPGLPVLLPETRVPRQIGETPDRLELTLHHSGEIFLGNTRLPPQGLRAALSGAAPGQTLLIRADRRLQFAEVRRVLQQASEAGFRRAALETLRRRP